MIRKTLTTLTLAIASLLASAQGYELPGPSGGSLTVLTKTGFTVGFSAATNTPRWVAWELTAEEAEASTASRTDEFLPDPDLGKGSPLPSDYTGGGYDRGHMAPAADMKWSEVAMKESFMMSNICPQNHVLNEKAWCGLEKQCRTWAKHYDRLWICCGPIYGKNPQTIGKAHSVAVPEAFFKVVLKQFKGRWYAVGFLFPNMPLAREGSFMNYAVSVDEVERRTGLDFFAALPEKTQRQVESVCDRNDWNYYMIPFKD